jgi:predicted negative regulator of RcsB-dependent stress response
MADEMLWNDDQKVEQIKKLWKQYGNLASAIVILVLITILGWQFWQRHEAKSAEQASIAYENILTSQQVSPAATANLAQQLKEQYSSTPYADFAAFILAKTAIDRGNYQQAAQQLEWVVEHTHSEVIEQIAQLRLARVWLMLDKPQNALDTLQRKAVTIYPGLAALVRGDAYGAMGETDNARQSYQVAITKLPKETELWSVASMKLNNLPASKL